MRGKENFASKLRKYVDGNADTPFEFFMLFVVLVNVVSLGIETSPAIMEKYGKILLIVDQVCLGLFIMEIIIKLIAFNKEFLGEFRIDENNEKFFHINKWNIFDLIIVIVSIFGTLPFFSVFRILRLFKSLKLAKAVKSLRIVKTLKLVNSIKSLRVMVKAIIKALPSVLWTFFLLIIFAYIYAVMGNSIFGIDFPEYFGGLKSAIFSLFKLNGIDSSEVISKFSWSWIYFVSYDFFEASIIMNVIVGVIVDAVNESQDEISAEEENKVELKDISEQLKEIKSLIENI